MCEISKRHSLGLMITLGGFSLVFMCAALYGFIKHPEVPKHGNLVAENETALAGGETRVKDFTNAYIFSILSLVLFSMATFFACCYCIASLRERRVRREPSVHYRHDRSECRADIVLHGVASGNGDSPRNEQAEAEASGSASADALCSVRENGETDGNGELEIHRRVRGNGESAGHELEQESENQPEEAEM